MSERRVIDGRDLVPPEPLELALAALDTMAPGEDLYLLLHCEAVPLYTILRRNGYPYSSRWLEDGTNEIRITKT
ncbi:MAG: sulfurtransferase TusA family protein [Betaproteobacteria bacterium]|nr:sulfurtransferase TusA family protein [Betaproteobacteria bacterium]